MSDSTPVSVVLDEHFNAFRFVLLREMGQLPKWEPGNGKLNRDISHAIGVWRRLRREVEDESNKLGPGIALAWLRQRITSTPEFRHFSRIRDAKRAADPRYQAAQRVRAADWYAREGKARRSSPEMRQKLNEQRRARYAAKQTIAAVLEEV